MSTAFPGFVEVHDQRGNPMLVAFDLISNVENYRITLRRPIGRGNWERSDVLIRETLSQLKPQLDSPGTARGMFYVKQSRIGGSPTEIAISLANVALIENMAVYLLDISPRAAPLTESTGVVHTAESADAMCRHLSDSLRAQRQFARDPLGR